MQTEARSAVPAAHDSKPVKHAQGASRQQVIAWLALCVTVGLVVSVYLGLSLSESADPLLMPLDDTYIHFQYARQVAHGELLVYNPGDPATSGGTSLLYPPLLAVGYVLGFEGWALAYWALWIGAVYFVGAVWLVYLIGLHNPLMPDRSVQSGYALAFALAFALAGPFVWAALSGMETSLFVFVVLMTFYCVQRRWFRSAMVAAALMALIRPEGLILAGITVLMLAGGACPSARDARIRRVVWLAIPLLAGVVQPLINVLATGGASSSGMQAKSHLYNSGAPLDQRVLDSADFFVRMWRELLSGRSPDFGTYTSPLLAPAALAALIVGVWWAWRRRRMSPAVLMLAWIVALTAAVSTLDTAFWQFKRYQLPVMALFFPATAWASALLGDLFERRLHVRWARWGLPVLIVIPSALTTITFARNYVENVTVVRDQQVPMAQWVRDHLPADARVGVHDVGLVRYFGDRALYDVVGLTTPGPARSWRQGPGAIFEHMANSDYRPDYFAIYPDVQGLRYLLDAGVFGDVLAEFPVTLPDHNVAAATGYQAVYRADWSNARAVEQVTQTTTLDAVTGLEVIDQVDVADLESEADHAYHWWQTGQPPGYVTEVYRNVYRACGLADEAACWATDGGRVLTGGEEFTLRTNPGEDLLLVTRVHGRTSVPFMVSINGERVDRVQPGVPGRWIEVVTWVPGERITGETTRVRIEPQIDDAAMDAYMPYYHWAYQGDFAPYEDAQVAPLAVFGDTGAVRLIDAEMAQQAGQLEVTLTWQGPAPGAGDGIVFIHLYNRGNVDVEPVAQAVSRPAGDVLPPGNWLPGVLEDHHTVTLPDDLPPGTYAVAVGLYDARTGFRFPVEGTGADDDRRLFIGEITIEE